MKTTLALLSLLLCLPLCADNVPRMVFSVSGAPASPLTAVTASKGFESGDLEAGATDFVEVDSSPGSKLDFNSSARAHSGSKSMQITWDADTITAYLSYDMGAGRTDASACFWMYVPTNTYGGAVTAPVAGIGSTLANYIANVYISYAYPSGVTGFRIRGTTFPSTVLTVTPGQWCRVEFKASRNGTCSLRVFDAGGTESGSGVTVTGSDYDARYVYLGISSTTTSRWTDGLTYDDIGIDSTDATHPLWEYSVSN